MPCVVQFKMAERDNTDASLGVPIIRNAQVLVNGTGFCIDHIQVQQASPLLAPQHGFMP